jgi:hypothetical protein
MAELFVVVLCSSDGCSYMLIVLLSVYSNYYFAVAFYIPCSFLPCFDERFVVAGGCVGPVINPYSFVLQHAVLLSFGILFIWIGKYSHDKVLIPNVRCEVSR